MKTVMCFGTFDLLHLGHLHYFTEAKKYGDYLIVVIARDTTKKKQGKEIIFSENERLKLVQHLDIVDEVVLGDKQDHFKIILEKKPDIVCLGYDHAIQEKDLAAILAKKGLFPQIKRISPYQEKKHKTSLLRQRVLKL